MIEQLKTIRHHLEPLKNNSGARKALTALDQIEKMVGSQVPVAWGMQHTDGAILDVISPEEHAREEGGYVVPLYRAAPVAQQPQAESVPSDVVRDAERYRWLRDQTTDDGIAIVMKNKCINDSISYAENINKHIDAAIAQQKGGV